MLPILVRDGLATAHFETIHPVATEELETIWELDLVTPPLDQRIVAAIVGVAVK